MLSLSLILASAAYSYADTDALSNARAQAQAQETRLTLESQLVVIADRDIHTARIEQDTAQHQIERAKATHDDQQLVYWSHRMEAAHAEEADAFGRYETHVGQREDARKEFRVATADVRRIEAREARR